MRVLAPLVSLLLFLLVWMVVPIPTEPYELREYFFIFELYPANYMWEGEEKTFSGTIYFWRPGELRMDDVVMVPVEDWKLWVNVTIELREFGVIIRESGGEHKVILRRYIEVGKDENYTLNFNYTGHASTQHELYVEIRHGYITVTGFRKEIKPSIRFHVYPVYRNVLYIKLVPSLTVAVVAGVVTELVRRARKGKLRKQINQ